MNLSEERRHSVTQALAEDIGTGDITAELVPSENSSEATVICRQPAIVCGQAWFAEVFAQLDANVAIEWLCIEGESVPPDTIIAKLKGNTRSLLTGERTALNFLQLLSGVATVVAHYVSYLAGTKTQLLDTRKTIPGLRLAQKYAVKCGGGSNHRVGLFDAFLIKENHIMGCGSIAKAIQQARQLYPDKQVEVEVESLTELETALAAQADIIMLDNFSIEAVKQAIALTQGQAKLEVSGNVTEKRLQQLSQLGVDYISSGALTKHLEAVDYSMRLVAHE